MTTTMIDARYAAVTIQSIPSGQACSRVAAANIAVVNECPNRDSYHVILTNLLVRSLPVLATFAFRARIATNRGMRRLAILLLCLSSFAGCRSFGSTHRKDRPLDPAKRESIDTMNAAEAEAHRETNNW